MTAQSPNHWTTREFPQHLNKERNTSHTQSSRSIIFIFVISQFSCGLCSYFWLIFFFFFKSVVGDRVEVWIFQKRIKHLSNLAVPSPSSQLERGIFLLCQLLTLTFWTHDLLILGLFSTRLASFSGLTVWPAFWQIVPPGKFPHGRWVQMGERLWRILWERKSIWTLTKGSTVCVPSILRQLSSNSHDQQKSTWGGTLPGVFQHLVSLPCKPYFNFIVLLALLGLCWGMWAFLSCFAQV